MLSPFASADSDIFVLSLFHFENGDVKIIEARTASGRVKEVRNWKLDWVAFVWALHTPPRPPADDRHVPALEHGVAFGG